MVSARCKMIVKAELEKMGLNAILISSGVVKMGTKLSETKHEELRTALLKFGLELIDVKKSELIEKTKKIIIEMVHYMDVQPSLKFSVYLSENLKYNYTALSRIFSEVQGTTIEQFIISHKIERVKDLLVYDELSLAEIAFKLHYSSAAHLSNQFKKVTGLTPKYFKKLRHKRLMVPKVE
ncbi:MAG: helix-turn-helix transcriptional regulator [Bacteroidia bacterium]|nr:helix-turn-helix transcriptional regulator [Bacteroidia bacterium]